MNHLITFGGAAYDRQTNEMLRAVQRFGCVDKVHVYDDRWLTRQPFYSENLWIFNRQPQHGFGFCSWKPYILRHALARAGRDDVVMYLDGDTYPIADFGELFELADLEDVVLFEEQGCVNKTWIKRECFERMGVSLSAGEEIHACGRFQLFSKRWSMLDIFLEDWQRFSLDPACTFHEGSKGGGDDPTFIRNSCEQSVLSLLAYRHTIPKHRTPDQNGWPISAGCGQPTDGYAQLFFQDGNRGNLRDFSGSRFRNVE